MPKKSSGAAESAATIGNKTGEVAGNFGAYAVRAKDAVKSQRKFGLLFVAALMLAMALPTATAQGEWNTISVYGIPRLAFQDPAISGVAWEERFLAAAVAATALIAVGIHLNAKLRNRSGTISLLTAAIALTCIPPSGDAALESMSFGYYIALIVAWGPMLVTAGQKLTEFYENRRRNFGSSDNKDEVAPEPEPEPKARSRPNPKSDDWSRPYDGGPGGGKPNHGAADDEWKIPVT